MKSKTTRKPKRDLTNVRTFWVYPSTHDKLTAFCEKRGLIMGRAADAAVNLYIAAEEAREKALAEVRA